MVEKKKKNLLWMIGRIVIGFSLAGFFIWKLIDEKLKGSTVEELENAIRGASPWLMTAAFLCFGVLVFITFIRWQMLLRVQDVHLPLKTVTKLGMIGMFFNTCLPGAVSGDFVKMVYVSKHAGKRTTEAVLTIMLDRVMGLYGLLIVAASACLLNLPYLLNPETDRKIQLATAFVGACSVAGLLGMLAVIFREPLQRLPGIHGLIGFGARKLPDAVPEKIERLVKGLDLYKQHKMTVVSTILMSVVVHCLNALCLLAIGRAYHEMQVGISRYFLTMQVSNSIASIPIFPGGMGMRDYVTGKFLTSGGATDTLAGLIPLTFTLVMVCWYLTGGVVFMFGHHHAEEDDDGEEAEAAQEAVSSSQ